MSAFTESDVEQAALDWLEDLGFAVKHGPEIAPGELAAEREWFKAVAHDPRGGTGPGDDPLDLRACG